MKTRKRIVHQTRQATMKQRLAAEKRAEVKAERRDAFAEMLSHCNEGMPSRYRER